jgi:hypothetical protein
MKLKSLIILLVITAVLAGLSILVLRPQKNEKTKIGALLLPDLPVNKVAQITLTTPESRVVLVKGSDVWQVENRFGYPADFDQISEFVRKFSKLKVGRSFEGTPDSLARLKLLDPTTSEAITQESGSEEGGSEEGASKEKGASDEVGPQNSGTRVQLADADGKKITAYILGSTRSTDSGSGGQYLRPAENDTVYLVDQSFRFLKKKPAEWLQHDVLNIKEDEVRQVECTPAEAEKPRFTVSRSEKGKPATLHEVPQGRKADPVKIEQLFGALAPLKIKDIAGKRQVPAPTRGDGLHLTYALFNGQRIDIYPREVGEGDEAQYELQAFVTYQAPPADEAASADIDAPAEAEASANAAGEKSAAPTAVGTPDEDTADTAKEKAGEDKAPTEEEVRALTDDLSAKLSGWTFVIEEWQWKSLITEVKGLLEDVKKEGEK